MKQSLLRKFLLAYLLFFALAFLFIATVSSAFCRSFLMERKVNSLYREANLLSQEYSEAKTGITEERVSNEIKAVARALNSEIWVTDSEGRILSDSKDGSRKGSMIPDFMEPDRSSGRYTEGSFHGMFSSPVLSVTVPIVRNYRTAGYLLLHEPLSEIVMLQNQFLNVVYLSGLVIFLLSLILLMVMALTVLRPLRHITEGATKYAQGDYHYKIRQDSRDEMGYLAETLNFMAEEIAKQDDYQKQFIANVSHDFRSPLTSIHGYLEAILDGTIPKEMEEKYLLRLINETERLTKLTRSMLTLDSLDQKGFLNRSNFDINRMIREVCESFEMSCEKRHIAVHLVFSEKKEMVYADFSKIQQVLYNLVDNAVKFSSDDSFIEIQTEVRGTKVSIAVRDNGIGIPRKDLQKIWDRFYKSDSSRGKDKHGTGLGLSIAKSLISAHGENIDCISTEGAGTEFRFTLPAAKAETG